MFASPFAVNGASLDLVHKSGRSAAIVRSAKISLCTSATPSSETPNESLKVDPLIIARKIISPLPVGILARKTSETLIHELILSKDGKVVDSIKAGVGYEKSNTKNDIQQV
jgi:hypothetical protein